MAEKNPSKRAWNFKDLTGLRFGRLTVVAFAGFTANATKRIGRWACRCNCGTEKVIAGHHLRSHRTVSCGCRHDTSRVTHGMCYSKEYTAWSAAKSRCTNPNNPGYHNYGG